MRSISFGALGTLSPQVQTGLEAALSNVEALHAQVLFDLRTLADQGESTIDYKAEADAIAQAITETRADMVTASDEDQAVLSDQIATLRAQAEDLLSRTGSARGGIVERQQLKGLWWGLGVVAVGGAITWFVWDQRKRRRR